jgi:hypothetical protein
VAGRTALSAVRCLGSPQLVWFRCPAASGRSLL